MKSQRQDFEQAIDHLVRMYRSLAMAYADLHPRNPDAFGLFAEGEIEHIRRLEATVADLYGRRAAEAYELRRWGGPPTPPEQQ